MRACACIELTLDGIKQFYVAVEREEWKLDTLSDLYETLTISQVRECVCVCVFACVYVCVCVQCIIYCNTIRKVDWLSDKMKARDFTGVCVCVDCVGISMQMCVSVDCTHIDADVCVCQLTVRISRQMCVCVC